MELTISNNIEDANEKLNKLEGIVETRMDGDLILLEYSESISGNDIIAFCINEGIKVEEARRSEARLEEIFMSLTDGIK